MRVPPGDVDPKRKTRKRLKRQVAQIKAPKMMNAPKMKVPTNHLKWALQGAFNVKFIKNNPPKNYYFCSNKLSHSATTDRNKILRILTAKSHRSLPTFCKVVAGNLEFRDWLKCLGDTGTPPRGNDIGRPCPGTVDSADIFGFDFRYFKDSRTFRKRKRNLINLAKRRANLRPSAKTARAMANAADQREGETASKSTSRVLAPL